MPVGKEYTYQYRQPPGLRRQGIESAPLYPLLLIQLYNGSSRPIHLEGLLDSGADTLLIPNHVAEALDLPRCGEQVSGGVFGQGRCFSTKTGFIIGRTNADMIDFGTVDAIVPAERGDIPILIGRDPLFRLFEVCFMEYRDRPAIKIIQKKPLPASGEDGPIRSIS